MSNERKLQVGVKALLQNSEGKFLLLKRNPEKYPEAADTWDIVGGRIDVGETLMENLKREIMEETQLELVSEPKLVAAQDILRVPGKHVVRLSYTATIDGEPTLDEEHSDFGWFTREEMLAIPKLDIYVRELLEGGAL